LDPQLIPSWERKTDIFGLGLELTENICFLEKSTFLLETDFQPIDRKRTTHLSAELIPLMDKRPGIVNRVSQF